MITSTSRLIVRQLEESDFAPFHEMQSDEEVMRYTTGKGLDANENLGQLRDCIARYKIPCNDFWVWAITRKLDDKFIGTCAIVESENRSEIGYRLLRRYFGNGYGQEICDGVIDYGISVLQLTEIIAFVDVRNAASRKILDRSRLRFISEQTDENGRPERFYGWSAGGKIG